MSMLAEVDFSEIDAYCDAMRMKYAGLSVLCGILVSMSIVVEAHKAEIECPEEIKTKQTAVVPPKGWATHIDTTNARQLFTGLSLYDGHPKDGASLFADEAAEATPSASAPASDATSGTLYKIPQGREAYLVCQYTNTLVRLIKKLPKDVQTCRVKFSETLGHVQKAVCD